MMEEMEKSFHSREIPFKAQEQRIMCVPHIINIIVQHVIKNLSKSLPPEGDDDNVDLSDVQPGDTIGRCRKIVISIRSSGQRKEMFDTWIKTGESCVSPTYF